MRIGIPSGKIKRRSRKKDNGEINKKIIKNFKNFFKVCVYTIGILTIGYYCSLNPIKYISVKLMKNDIVNEVYSMVEINRKYLSTSGEKVLVKGFDLEMDTLPFKNFETKSFSGNCEGYNMYELLHFEGKLEQFLGENMNSKNEYDFSKISLSENDVNNIYAVGETEDKKEEVKHYFDIKELEGYTIDYEYVVEQAYEPSKSSSEEIESDFNDKEFDNNELKNILMDIEYLQNNKGYTCYITKPYYSTDLKSRIKGEKDKYSSGDFYYIKQNIDNDKLTEIGITNNMSGHSLLAYSYEKINENNYKVYVKDSNFPLIKKDVLSDEDIKVNNDIKNNFYILFTKDILNDEWSYIYQPSINGIEVYGYYNSFVPGTRLYLYSTGI